MTAVRLAEHLAVAGLSPAAAVIRHLESGHVLTAGHPGWDVYPASMLKTPLCVAALTLCALGELSLPGRHTVTRANMTVNDKPSPLVPGYDATLEELIELAVTRSDNVATNMLYDLAGRERATEICSREYGLTGTAFARKLSGDYPLINDPQWDGASMNRHSPADAARTFELIASGQVPHAALMLDLLARQEWNDKLSLGLQAGDRFAHKTGDTDEVTHDGGVLTLANGARFVLAVYAHMPSSAENNGRFRTFMESLRKDLTAGV